uniref:Uncharacterized protein n=1 Tax=Anabas testudineus TaxID=64144 RepID=A0A3Q1JCR1_ANATE
HHATSGHQFRLKETILVILRGKARHSTDSLQSKRSHRLQKERGGRGRAGEQGGGQDRTKQAQREKETRCKFHLPCMTCSGGSISLSSLVFSGQSWCPLRGHARNVVTSVSKQGWTYTAFAERVPKLKLKKYPYAFNSSKTIQHATAKSSLKSFQH